MRQKNIEKSDVYFKYMSEFEIIFNEISV